jgi:hypothetical protein
MDYRHLANTTAELPKTDFEKRAGQKQVGGQHAFFVRQNGYGYRLGRV